MVTQKNETSRVMYDYCLSARLRYPIQKAKDATNFFLEYFWCRLAVEEFDR